MNTNVTIYHDIRNQYATLIVNFFRTQMELTIFQKY